MNICSIIDQALGPPLCQLCGGRGLGPEICLGCYRDLPRAFRVCTVCARPISRDGVCGRCVIRSPVYDHARVPYIYGFPVDRLIRRLKYNAVLSHGRLLGELAGHAFRRNPGAVEALVPVPPHPKRLRRRGFDHVVEIGRHLARIVGLPLRIGFCRRRRDTPPLWPLRARERRQVLKDAFECRRRAPARVAILDDVLTTGSTADAIAAVLRAAGARKIEIWAVARSPAPPTGWFQDGTRA